jgi:hypothetical protein
MSHDRALHERREHGLRPAADPSERLDVGDDVEVFSGYEGTWSGGFSVAEVLRGDRYRLRRGSDDALLPDPTGADDLRRLPHAAHR